MRKNIVLDIDGVIADFEGYFCKQFGDEHREKVKLEERYPEYSKGISLFTQSIVTYNNLQPLALGVKIAQYLDSQKEFDICLVSSRPTYCLESTNYWMKKNQIPYMTLSCGNDKIKRIMKLDPLFAIEDMGEEAIKMRYLGIPVILISQPYNKKYEADFPRISEFWMFLRQFEKILDSSKYEVLARMIKHE